MSNAAITVDLNARIANFETELKRATGTLDTFGKKGDQIAAGLKGAFAGMVAGLSVGALVSFAKSGIDAADALNDMSQRLGVSVKNLASLKLAAEQSGTSLDNVGAGIARLSKSIGEAEGGNKKLAEALTKLGITARDPKEAFFQLADAVKSIEDPSKRAALLSQVLGKSYGELVPLLAQGGTELRKSAQASESFANAMERLAPEADKLNDQLAELKINAAGAAATILSELVPSFNEWIAVGKEVVETGTLLDKVRFFALGNASDEMVNRVRLNAIAASGWADKLKASVATLNADKAKPIDLSAATTKKTSKKAIDKLDIYSDEQARNAKLIADETERIAGDMAFMADVDLAQNNPIAAMTQEWIDAGIALHDSVLTPLEKYNQKIEYLDELYRRQVISLDDLNRAKKQAFDSIPLSDYEKEMKRVNESIENSLTDALLRGFESGKDIASNFIDTLKNMFSTLILKPLIQPIASAAAGGVTGLLGSGSAAASGGASSAGNLASSLLPSIFSAGEVSASIGMMAGGIAETLGASSAFAGSIGSAVAAIPVAGWIAAGALVLSSFFGGKPSNKAAMGSVDLSTGSTFGLGNMTGDKQASQETIAARDATLQTIGAFTGLLKTMGGDIPWSTIYADIGERDGVQFEIDGGPLTTYGSNPDEAIAKLFDEMVAGTDGLSESVKALLIGFEGVGTEMTSFAETLSVLTDYQKSEPLSEMLDAMAQSAQSLYQQLQISKVATYSLADAFDGSLDSSTNLANAVKIQYNLELQLIGQIQQALTSTTAMFGASIEQIQLSVLGPEQQYDYWRSKIDADMAALMTATDPAEISRLSASINQGTNAAFGLLDDTQKTALASEFIAYLDAASDITTERLNASQSDVLAIHQQTTDTLEAAMMRVADRMMAAANTPVQVAVDVNVDTPANVEVYVG